MAVLFDLPTEEQVLNKWPVRMIVAPSGCKFVPDQTVSKEFLIENGWTEQLVRVPTTRGSSVQNVAGFVRAIRYQYSLQHYIGSTIHAIMGQTLL